ncbi:MAG: anti-sigma factor [Candidatus Methylomirabilia bacterium]
MNSPKPLRRRPGRAFPGVHSCFLPTRSHPSGDTPLSAGVFSIHPTGRGSLPGEARSGPERCEGFAVTLERAGGVPAPSGEMRREADHTIGVGYNLHRRANVPLSRGETRRA